MDNREGNQKRTVVPRWRLLKSTPATELRSVGLKNATFSLNQHRVVLEKALADWKADATIVNAAEVADAISLVGFDIRAVAPLDQLLSSKALRNLESPSKNSRGKDDAEPPLAPHLIARRKIQSIKSKLIEQPRDALGYVDLSRTYVAVGQTDKSKEAMRKAVSLARNDRFVLRSACRLYCHLGDVEQAYDLLRNSDAVRLDPWVMSAEVATADLLDRTPRFGTKALTALVGASSISKNYSELASALGTLEMKSGSYKRAKKLISRSLDSPTENALAQAFSLRRDLQLSFAQLPSVLNSKGAYEAAVLQSVVQGNFERADDSAWLWLDDEPFSVRAAIHGSYINSSSRREFDRALEFTERGLIANPDDEGLINNKVFALLQLGRLGEAKAILPRPFRSEVSTSRRVFDLALNGLFSFKEGSLNAGRAYYSRAIDEARTVNGRLGYRASIHWLEQEVLSGQLGLAEGMEFIAKVDAVSEKLGSKFLNEAQTWKVAKLELVNFLEHNPKALPDITSSPSLTSEALEWSDLADT